ncbi:Nucleolar MIF4G domain-containing protein 1, variant 2 [Bonamia ostreae]|uniref:Nucleolar MIF4G domain-containing protein 1, variant 2 n=1 Tax=Bonamia ostreae TaxID=126728 RepID=A0ABV2AGL5_9EUKA
MLYKRFRSKKLTRKEKRKNARKEKKKSRFLKQRGTSHFQNSQRSIKKIIKNDNAIFKNKTSKKDQSSTGIPALDILGRMADNILESAENNDYLENKRTQSQMSKTKKTKNGENKIKSQFFGEKLNLTEKFIPKFKQTENKNIEKNVNTKVRIQINKLTPNNIEIITNEILKLYSDFSQNETNEAIMDCVFDSLFMETEFSDTLAITSSGLIAAINFSNIELNYDVFFLDKIVNRFSHFYNEKDTLKIQKTMLLIAYLYCFKVIDVKLISDILEKLLNSFLEFDLQMLLIFVKEVSHKLRKENSAIFQQFFNSLNNKFSSLNEKELKEKSKKFKYLVEFINDVKTKNSKDKDIVTKTQKWLKNFICKNGITTKKNSLCLGLSDFTQNDKIGKWWIDLQLKNKNKNKNFDLLNVVKDEKLKKSLFESSGRCGMSTNAQKIIFVLIQSSEVFTLLMPNFHFSPKIGKIFVNKKFWLN